MASRLEDGTQDERALLIGAACRECVAGPWPGVLEIALTARDPWLPWLVQWDHGDAVVAHGFLTRPTSSDVKSVRGRYGPRCKAAVVDLVKGLRDYTAVAAAAEAAQEDRYPLIDRGPADWLG